MKVRFPKKLISMLGRLLLVAGGLVRNLPVDVARDMGADVVIAIDVGTKLSTAKDLKNALAIVYQMSGLLTVGNTNQQIGTAPATVPHIVSVEEQKQGFKILPAVTARWVSGAVASTDETRVDLNTGYSQEFTLVRPPDAPGVEIDASYASDTARNKIEAERNDIMVGRVTQ